MVYKLSKVEGSENKQAIDRDLMNRVPYNKMAEKYEISPATLSKYYNEKLLPQWGKVLKEDRKRDVDYLLTKMDKLASRSEKLLDACDKWLSDPNHPDEYTLDPRANELDVIYFNIDEDGHKIRHKDSMQNMLDKLQGAHISKVVSKTADPRELILKATKEVRESIKLIAEITGELNNVTSVVDIKVLMPNMLSIITEATGMTGEIQQAISKALLGVVGDVNKERLLP